MKTFEALGMKFLQTCFKSVYHKILVSKSEKLLESEEDYIYRKLNEIDERNDKEMNK